MRNFFKKLFTNIKKIKPSTVVRCLVYIVVLANQALAVCGTSLPFTSEVAYQVTSIVLTILVGLWTAWKNNDITPAAITAGKVFNALKDGRITEDEAKDLIESADTLVTAEDENEEDDNTIDED